MARQLTLDLTMPPASSRDDFLITAANRDALAMLDAPGRWPQGRLLLIGGPGSGKTHLVGFWAAEHGAHVSHGWTLTPESVDDLVRPGAALVIEQDGLGSACRVGVAAEFVSEELDAPLRIDMTSAPRACAD